MLIYSIEDDEDIALIIKKTLIKQGFEVESYNCGKDFFNAFEKKKPDIILLDLMLPDIDGKFILKQIRSMSKNDDIHIIIISAKHMITDKVEGLDLGADDYIEKPFDLLELMARVEAQARRLNKKKVICKDDVILKLDERECYKNNSKIDLTVKEFDILTLLIKNSPNVISREQIFENIWNTNEIVESRTVDMHIKSLRAKLSDDGSFIKTVYGIGYKI